MANPCRKLLLHKLYKRGTQPSQGEPLPYIQLGLGGLA
jgi:hypothetical protein